MSGVAGNNTKNNIHRNDQYRQRLNPSVDTEEEGSSLLLSHHRQRPFHNLASPASSSAMIDSYFLPGGILDPEDSQQQQHRQQQQVGVAVAARPSTTTTSNTTTSTVNNKVNIIGRRDSNNNSVGSGQLRVDDFNSSYSAVTTNKFQQAQSHQQQLQQQEQQLPSQQEQQAVVRPFRSRLDETYNAGVAGPLLEFPTDTVTANNIANIHQNSHMCSKNQTHSNNVNVTGNTRLNSLLLSSSDRPGVSGLDPTGDDVVNVVGGQPILFDTNGGGITNTGMTGDRPSLVLSNTCAGGLTATGLSSVMDAGTAASSNNNSILMNNSVNSNTNHNNNTVHNNMSVNSTRTKTASNQHLNIPDWFSSTANTIATNTSNDRQHHRQQHQHLNLSHPQFSQQQQQQQQQQQMPTSNTNSNSQFFSDQKQHVVVAPLQPLSSSNNDSNLESLFLGAFAPHASSFQEPHQHQGNSNLVTSSTPSSNHLLVSSVTSSKHSNMNIGNGGNNTRGNRGDTGVKRSLPSSAALSKDATTTCVSGSSSNDSRINSNQPQQQQHRPNQNPWSKEISSIRKSTTSSVVTHLHHTGRYGTTGSIGGAGDRISTTGTGAVGRKATPPTSSSSSSLRLVQQQQQQQSGRRPPPGFVSPSQDTLLSINQQQQQQQRQQTQVLIHPRSHDDVPSGDNSNNNSSSNDRKGRSNINEDSAYRLPIGNEATRGIVRNSTHPQIRQQHLSPQQHQHHQHHQHHSSVIRAKKSMHVSSHLHHPSHNTQQLQGTQQQLQHDNGDIMDQMSLNSRGVPSTIYVRQGSNVDEDAVSNSEDTLTVCADSITESSLVGVVHSHSHSMPPIKSGTGAIGGVGGGGGNTNKYVENSERRMDVLEETSGAMAAASEKRTKPKRQKKKKSKKRNEIQAEVKVDDATSRGGSSNMDENHGRDGPCQVGERKNDDTASRRRSKSVEAESSNHRTDASVNGDNFGPLVPTKTLTSTTSIASPTVVQRKLTKKSIKGGQRNTDHGRGHGRSLDKGENIKLKKASNRNMKPRKPLRETLTKTAQTLKPILVDFLLFCFVKFKSLTKTLFWSIILLFPKKERFWFLLPLFCIIVDFSYLTVCLTFQGIGKVVYVMLLMHKLALVEMLESDSAALCYALTWTYPGIAVTVMMKVPCLPYGSSFVGWYIIVRWMCRPISMRETFLSRLKAQEMRRNAMNLVKGVAKGGENNVKSMREVARLMKIASEKDNIEETERVKGANQLLSICRKLIPVMLLLEGTTNGQGVIMSMSRCERIFLGYACAVARSGYIFSPLIWLSFTFQLLLVLCCPSTVLCGHILFLLGLTSIRLTHYTSSVEDFKAKLRNRST